jgi:hypothetical protein
MVIEIRNTTTKAEMQRIPDSLPKPKRLDAKRFVGTVKWPEDALAYQKRLRDAW